MKLGLPKEDHPYEFRATLIPADVKKLSAQGIELVIESGMGEKAGYLDQEYRDVGAIVGTLDQVCAAEMVARIHKPEGTIIDKLKTNSIHISFLDPFNSKETLDSFVRKEVSSFSLEMIPRTTKAQKMDVLSSQASLAGYVAVILAAGRLNKIFPMMMTPAGTISPSKVFIIGAGVAGLQAIATAKRLGARVEAFDTRPVVAEQVESLGGKFVKVDLGEMGQTKDGYAKQLTEDQLEKQRQVMAKHCASADVVITTAQLFGRKAPLIVTEEMVNGMKPGSIIVDLAVETGGNVAGSKVGEEVVIGGVKIIGLANLPALVATHASQMLSSNITNFILEYWNSESKQFNLNREDEIIKGCLITHGGAIVNERLN